jgi:hypothetical protein
VIEGVPVIVPEQLEYYVAGSPYPVRLHPGQVLLIGPNHQLNPTDGDVFICDLDTYVSLEAQPDVQAALKEIVISTRRLLRAKERNEQRLERRRIRRARWAEAAGL